MSGCEFHFTCHRCGYSTPITEIHKCPAPIPAGVRDEALKELTLQLLKAEARAEIAEAKLEAQKPDSAT